MGCEKINKYIKLIAINWDEKKMVPVSSVLKNNLDFLPVLCFIILLFAVMGFSDLYEISYDTARIGMHATLGCMEGVNFLIHTEIIHK